MTVLVSMPFFGAPELLERAVRSVLAQTHRDLQLLVVADGMDAPITGIADSRLDVYRLPENRGAYFAQAIALSANPHAWYAPVGADDWLDPDHVEKLAAFGTDVATGAVWYHLGDRPVKIMRKLYEVGMYRTERMRAVGGYNPAERIGQDSLTLKVMRLVAPMPSTTEPTYHRLSRRGSLSTHPDTKRGSPARNAMRQRNRAIVARCEQLATAEAIRAYRASLIPVQIADEVAFHVDALRTRLGQQVAA